MASINVCVDYGNSSAKVGIFEDHELREKFVFANPVELRTFLQKSNAQAFIVSSVSNDPHEVSSWSQAKRKFILHHTLPLPITNRYATPATLGVDRLAGV